MIENLYEQIVTDTRKNSNTKYYAAITATVICTMIAIVLFAMTLSSRFSLYFLIPLLLFIALGVFFYVIKDYALTEYEYSFLSGTLEVSRIINNKRRKTLFKCECEELEAFSKRIDDKDKRYATMPNIRIRKAVFNLKSDDIYFAYLQHNGYKYLLYFAPDATLLTGIKKHLKVHYWWYI